MAGLSAFAQTDGLIYQSVILDPNAQELPGEDITGNILPNAPITVKFVIEDLGAGLEYEETHETVTDSYGMIKLLVGAGNASFGNFQEISWDGTQKNLKVDIALGGNFKRLSSQKLLFIPYSFHRNITASGTVLVSEESLFDSNLVVDGETRLRDATFVNNESPTELSGSLIVAQQTTLQDSLSVLNESATYLSGTLDVDLETQLNSTLEVDKKTGLHENLIVDGTTTLNSRLTVANSSPTLLTGTLDVGNRSDFNNTVNINNGSDLQVSGDMTIYGETTLQSDLTVNGDTNFNSLLNVNNASPTSLTGTLGVNGQTTLQNNLLVLGSTDLDNLFRVNGLSPTTLSGSLEVGLATNLNSNLNVNNGSATMLSGSLNVNGDVLFDNDVNVSGVTNLNNALNVNNGNPSNLSGILGVDGPVQMDASLEVAGETTFNNNLDVLNASEVNLTGTLDADGSTVLNNELTVTNVSPTNLNGTLTVDELTLLNNTLAVTNGSASNLSGILNVDDQAFLNNGLEVANLSSTLLSGSLLVDGNSTINALSVVGGSTSNPNGEATTFTGTLNVEQPTTLQSTLTISDFTTMNNTLAVTGDTQVTNLFAGFLAVSDVVENATGPAPVATFSNVSTANTVTGISVKLGSNHGRWTGSSLLKVDQTLVSNDPSSPPTDPTYQTAFNTLKSKFTGNVDISVNDVINLAGASLRLQGTIEIQKIIIQEIGAQIGLPKGLPGVNFPSLSIPKPPGFDPLFPGINAICSGQYCYSICFPFAGCVRICVPPVNVCVPSIPRIDFPNLSLNALNLRNFNPNFAPSLPTFNSSFPEIVIPNIPIVDLPQTLSKQNVFISFEDNGDRALGGIKAQSISDFANNTVLDDVYAFNVASKFVGIDLLNGVAKGGAVLAKLVKEFNAMGVQYHSGNGDYAEWLPRENFGEYLTAGDIISIKAGKISKNLEGAEQLMVISHRPIVLGNEPSKENFKNGNTVAFIGQVPVKVMGVVHTGDYIVAKSSFGGFGIAVAPDQMTTLDFQLAVGRAWETKLTEGPKMVNTVVGLQNGDWSAAIAKLAKKQNQLDENLTSLEAKLQLIANKIKTSQNENDYATKD